jgi:tRNA(Ile)-lysidine synthase
MKSLTNFAERASTSQLLLNELADEDIEKSLNGGLTSVSLNYIQNMSEARIKNFLYRWIWRLSNKSLGTSMIGEVYHSIFKSKSSASPKVFIGLVDHADSFEIRRYDDKLYAIPYESKSSLQDIIPLAWDLISPLTLSTGKLSSTKIKGRGLRYDKSLEAEVRGRNGGEIIRPPGRNCSKSLKKLFQEEYIPPWLRERVPLIYLNNELAAVANLWIDEKFLALENEQGVELSWQDNTFS